jgi:hypothetical protein
MNHVGSFSKNETNALQSSIMSIINSPDALRAMCAEIKTVGPPNYYPAYMVQHGINAFTGGSPSGSVKADFNVQEAWEKALVVFLNCPKT